MKHTEPFLYTLENGMIIHLDPLAAGVPLFPQQNQ
jgi:hypothetical protein